MKKAKNQIYDLRRDYSGELLNQKSVPKKPLEFFHQWMKEAINAQISEPNAVTLATSTTDGKPSARVLLLREATESGFVFFTNYQSRKGKTIELNPHGCLNFFWAELGRQVRVEGKLIKVEKAYSDEYFASRPRASQIGAWASAQSEVIKDRSALEIRFKKIEKLYAGKKIPRPPHWGGFRLIPEQIEFWQGRENRLHDRLQYTKKGSGWTIVRLSP